MENDWNLFIDLDLEKQDNKLPKNSINVNNVKSKASRYNYTFEEKKEEETDFFKKKTIKEKNMYINSFGQYKLQIKK